MLELLAGAAWAWVVAARISRLAQLAQSLPRGAVGEPGGLDIASSGGDPVNKSLMSCNAILVRVDQILQPVPAAFGAIEVDHLKPVRPRVNQRLPTHRIERDPRDVAAAPLVDDWHAVCLRSCAYRNAAHSTAGHGSA